MVMTTKGNNMKQRIGFIGMGHMGSHMAQRLLEAGYQLAIYDRTLERALEVAQQRATVARTPRELAAQCEVLMVCVTDDEAQQIVMFGQDGALAGVHGGSMIIFFFQAEDGIRDKLVTGVQTCALPI